MRTDRMVARAVDTSDMIYRSVRDAAEFHALVIAAFFVRNTRILFALSALALLALATS